MILRMREAFPELKAELFTPAKNLMELIVYRWTEAIDTALTFRNWALTRGLMRDESLALVGNPYITAEIAQAMGGTMPRHEDELEYVMRKLGISLGSRSLAGYLIANRKT